MPEQMSPQAFVAKWSPIQQKETAVSQSHFNDICRLIGHPLPLDYDPEGKHFSFETQTVKPDGSKGFADVFFRSRFIWEYKGPHKDLDRAYQQLQLYREYLENPPLLITSDIHTIVIHTNFNNYPTKRHLITFDDIASGDGVEKLRWAFFEPGRFRPAQNQQEITKASAATFIAVAETMKGHQKLTGEEYTPEQLAHFLVRLLFCLFAEDMGLLPNNLFTEMLKAQRGQNTDLRNGLRNLFREMRGGGTFGYYRIRQFNGTLFDDEFVPEIPLALAQALLNAAVQDWSAVDPSIFGTLFERVIDESKRAQLGAHYTSEDDIMLIVEPVLMAPYKEKWETTRRRADRLVRDGKEAKAHTLLAEFAAEIAAVRVLDPACGSGNFLYVALRELLDLQKAVIAWASRRELAEIPLTVNPEQLYGIEINTYAHELAQITAWIGYLQWRNENGFGEMDNPVLRPLRNIQRMDAILAYDDAGRPFEPEWPQADAIIGNPPFLGGNRIRQELGDETVDSIFEIYDERVPAFADLVCYWFEKARDQIEMDHAKRAGLIATNSIRGGVNREVLKRVKNTGDIFMAWSDEPWVLDGAAVRVSMIAFDDGSQEERFLNGAEVTSINTDLTASVDITRSQGLLENKKLCFIGTKKAGNFDIEEPLAKKMLDAKNTGSHVNRDVIFPWLNGSAVVRRMPPKWIIYFAEMPEDEAASYEMPYEYVKDKVHPVRVKNNEERARRLWWQHRRPATEMWEAANRLTRYIITPRVSKFRLFVWVASNVLPDDGTYMFAREDDYFFGLLQSSLHEMWSLRSGTWLGKGNDPRYTPTTCFETFPFPWPPGQEPAEGGRCAGSGDRPLGAGAGGLATGVAQPAAGGDVRRVGGGV